MQPVPERLEDMALADGRRPVEVGRGASDPPGSVEAASRQPALISPALQRTARLRRQGVRFRQDDNGKFLHFDGTELKL